MSFGGPPQISLRPTPPDRGSFPLDHEGECKQFMQQYLRCLKENSNSNKVCREASKSYLECRMQRGLMDREEWSKLGYFNEKDGLKDQNASTASKGDSSAKKS